MLAASALALPPTGAAGQLTLPDQQCDNGSISHIFIDNQSIFDTNLLSSTSSVRWAYDLANFLHVETRKEFISRELLFGVGDCPEPVLLQESERLLRELRFIARADVFALPQSDGTQHVVVDTRDEWTTKVQIDVTVDDGVQFEGARVTEENFLGRGHLIGLFFQERKQRQDYGISLETPQLLGSRWNGRFKIGRTRVGELSDIMLVYPFVGEVGLSGTRLRFRRMESLFPYVLDLDPAYSHVVLPILDERIEATQAFRFGNAGDLTLLGFGVTRELLRLDDYPGSVDLVAERDFGNPLPDEPGFAAGLAGQARSRATTRVNLLLGKRNVRYVRRQGLDAVTGVRDVPLGTDITVTLGRSVPIFGFGSDEPTNDAIARLSLFGGVAPGSTVLLANAQLEGRRLRPGNGESTGWKDVLSEVDVLAYWQPGRRIASTIAARVAGAGGWNTITPFQLTLGGRDLVRGLREEDSPGGRRIVASIEDRIDLRWPAPTLFDLGITVFADAGKVWAGDAPFGADSRWESSIGAGLRFGFPAGSSQVLRIDFAKPIGASLDRGLVFRVSSGDFVGLLYGFDDLQMFRSRRSGVNSDFQSIASQRIAR